MQQLRFGICGFGFIGQTHFSRIHAHPDATVVAICDRDPSHRNASPGAAAGNLDLAGDPAAAPVADYRRYADTAELLADAEVDAVVVALPTRLHAPVAIAALAAGKHVLSEKPMAFRVHECTQMIDAAASAGRILMTAHCLRFWPQYERVRELVSSGSLGRVHYVGLRRTASPPTYSTGNWLLDADQSGGALLDLHIHDVDYAHSLLGVPRKIAAAGRIDPPGGLNHVVANWTYDDGRYAAIEGGWTRTPNVPFEMALVVHAERGTLSWSSLHGDDVLLYGDSAKPERVTATGDAFESQLGYFISCVRTGAAPDRCSPAATRASLGLAWLGRRSVELGRTVEVSDKLRAAWGV